MLLLLLLALPSLPGLGAAQQAGTVTTERHPKLAWKHCISPGTCLTLEGELTIDSNWRWTYDRETYDDCYSPSSGWNSAVCTDGRGCADRCALDGVDNYAERFGVFTCRDSVMLEFTNAGDEAVNIGSRMYLMATPTKYQTFSLLGNELTFDVDTSRLGCEMNGALYFVAMDEDGGMAKYPGNKAGAKYGTGYCDARCPRGARFVNGEANLGSQGVRTGRDGSCCAEIDVWHGNVVSTTFSAQSCRTSGQGTCEGNDGCNTAIKGCDENAITFRSSLYGPSRGHIIDSTRRLTVVTRFVPGPNNTLAEIQRVYVQDGLGVSEIVAEQSNPKQLGNTLSQPMVLAMAVWDDYHANVLWRDSAATGLVDGECEMTAGAPSEIELEDHIGGGNYVVFSNIRFGPIGSTLRLT
ncbi:hypothetical protein VTJ04DRAFT_10178 [Mycothermus thermophilus]|uniref:uncharacterized protein n=1 Tax=Humicola insolens TaxID=85995 RepID=UPI003742E410